MKNIIDESIKKSYVTKGFLSKGVTPSNESVNMYMIYLSNLPQNWDERIIHKPSVEKVREYFGVNYGFETMIRWGMSFDCRSSKTSSNRHKSMNTAYTLAKASLSAGVFVTDKKLVA